MTDNDDHAAISSPHAERDTGPHVRFSPAAALRATGTALRQQRLERGLSLDDVSRATGYAYGTVKNLERAATPSLVMVATLVSRVYSGVLMDDVIFPERTNEVADRERQDIISRRVPLVEAMSRMGPALRAWRYQNNITARRFAADTAITETALNSLETGSRRVALAMVILAAMTYGVTVEELVFPSYEGPLLSLTTQDADTLALAREKLRSTSTPPHGPVVATIGPIAMSQDLVNRLVPPSLAAIIKAHTDNHAESERGRRSGRRTVDPLDVLPGIVYGLMARRGWQAVPPEFGASGWTLYRYFSQWSRLGVWEALAEADSMDSVSPDDVAWIHAIAAAARERPLRGDG